MTEKRANRSNAYQHLFGEVLTGMDLLESFSDASSMYKRLNPFEYNERIAELEDQLKIEFWRVVDENLTKRQKEVIELVSVKKMTQQEAAKMLGVNQSSITKSLHGNVDYSKRDKNNNIKRISYGGSVKKLKLVIQNDEKIKYILQQISDLREETWSK